MTNLPTELLWGEDAIEEEIGGLRFRVRPNAFLQTNTEMAEQLYAIAREFAALDRRRDRLRPLLRHRHDRPLDGGDALTVWGIEISEESVACAIENQELNGDRQRRVLRRQRRRGAARPARPRRRPGRRRRRPAARRPRRQGAASGSARSARRASSTSAATRRRSPATLKRLARRLRLPARARAAGRHVPAHAARRVRRAARARA